jgi:hypothetical protein
MGKRALRRGFVGSKTTNHATHGIDNSYFAILIGFVPASWKIWIQNVGKFHLKTWSPFTSSCTNFGKSIVPDLPDGNVANLDETSLTPERRKSRVLAAKGARRTHTLCNDARFSMTALPVVFADGTEMPPHFIIKGKRRPKWWGSSKYCLELTITGTELEHATLSVQENG